jgi:DNA-binding transcriptional MerR regulator
MSNDTANTTGLISIGDAAQAREITRSTLTHWAGRGVLRPARRTPGGHMRWDLDDLRA